MTKATVCLFKAMFAFFFLSGCGKEPDPKIVRQLEQQGIDYSESDFRYRVSRGETEIVKLYLLAGVDPNAVSTKRNPDMPALCTAAEEGRTEITALLLEYGADPNKGYYRDDKTPLLFAAEAGHLDIVNMLLKAGVPVDYVDDGYTYTALIYAAKNGHTNIVRVLLDQGADVNYTASERFMITNGLILAAYHGQVEAVKLLLDEGARVDVKNHEGKTVLDIAEEQVIEHPAEDRYQEIVQLLTKK